MENTGYYYKVPTLSSVADLDAFLAAIVQKTIQPAGSYTLTEYADGVTPVTGILADAADQRYVTGLLENALDKFRGINVTIIQTD